jgi:hypothetical protein
MKQGAVGRRVLWGSLFRLRTRFHRARSGGKPDAGKIACPTLIRHSDIQSLRPRYATLRQRHLGRIICRDVRNHDVELI